MPVSYYTKNACVTFIAQFINAYVGISLVFKTVFSSCFTTVRIKVIPLRKKEIFGLSWLN